MSAVARPAAAHAEVTTHGRTLGWYGMVFFLASEAFFFANLIASYLYLHVRNGGPLPGKDVPDVLAAAINTVILLASSFPMHYGARAIARGNRRGLIWGLAGTAILGTIFLAGQAREYILLIGDGFVFGSPKNGLFASAFFTLTGFHGAHVTVGVIFLLILLIRSLRGNFSAPSHFAITAGEMYWHFVDVVWIILFSVLYLLP